MLISILRYAGQAIALFAVGAVLVSVLELFEDRDLITKEIEGLIRFAACGTLVVFLISLTVRAPISETMRFVIVIGCVALTAEYLISYTEDVRSLDSIPLIGRRSEARRLLEPTFSAIWTLMLFFVAYRSVRGLRSLHTQALRQERLRAIGEMTSGITHDLNNALTPLIGAAELLTASIHHPSQEQSEHLHLLQQAALDLSGIVERVSHFHTVSPNTDRHPTSLAELVQESAVGIQPKLRSQQGLNGAAIQLEIDIVDAQIQVRPTEIRTVLTNLLFNAVHAMPDGGKILISNYFRGSTVFVAVADTGTGMTAEELQRCQEPFYTTKSAGSGLGLATCRQIIESYGAELVLNSQAGTGTTAEFSLPTLQDSPPEPDLTHAPDAVQRMRILLVEDEPAVQSAIVMMLDHLGMETECAANAECAIQLLTERDFDFVITDFGLPDVSGADLIQKIRILKQDIKVAVLSGWSSESVADRCDPDAFPDDILHKPVTIEDLRSLLVDTETRRPQFRSASADSMRPLSAHKLHEIGGS